MDECAACGTEIEVDDGTGIADNEDNFCPECLQEMEDEQL